MAISSINPHVRSVNDRFASIKQNPPAERLHLLIIDSGIDGYHALQSTSSKTVTVCVLHPHQDGVAQITAAIQGEKFHSLQILAHGSSGGICLGNIQLNSFNLSSYVTELQQWQVKEIALYACEVAEGATGQAFIQQLASITGANVAASGSKVGHHSLGGSWDLAVQTGAVTTPLLIDPEVVAHYVGILADSQLSPTSNANSADYDAVLAGLMASNSLLNSVAHSSNYWTIFDTAFGSNYKQTLAALLQQQWQAGDFSSLPTIQVLDSGMGLGQPHTFLNISP